MKFTVPIKENRLFRRLYSSKKNAVCPYFVLYCRKNNLGINRLGITTGVKLGCAVERNRARRRLRELYRLHEGQLCPSYDIVIVARGKLLEAPFSALEKAFISSAAFIGLLDRNASSQNG